MNSNKSETMPLQTLENTYEATQLNPLAPNFVPQQLYPCPPAIFFPLPPPQPFLIWYNDCYLSPHLIATKPSISISYHQFKQVVVAGGPSPALLPSPTNPKCADQGHISWRGRRAAPRRCWKQTRMPRRPLTSSNVWVEKPLPKAASASSSSSTSPAPVSFYPFGDSTSLMIRHIPVRLSRRELMDMLDEHCREENEMRRDDEPPSEFDFLYLPIDFKRRGNLGYAFVNFTTWEGASRLFNSWRGTKWESCSYNSHKIRQICRAKLQGREALKRHFKGSIFYCGRADYLPVEIMPARNGSNSHLTKLITIGTRVAVGNTEAIEYRAVTASEQ